VPCSCGQSQREHLRMEGISLNTLSKSIGPRQLEQFLKLCDTPLKLCSCC